MCCGVISFSGYRYGCRWGVIGVMVLVSVGGSGSLVYVG